jgi:hypothetical protein
MIFHEAAAAIVAAGQRMHAMGWVPATAGNISIRQPSGRIAITRSGCHKGFLAGADVIRIDADGAAIDPAVAEPALGARDEAHRRLGAELPGELSHGEREVGLPRQSERAGRELTGVRKVEERGQELLVLDLADADVLGDVLDVQRDLFALAEVEVDVRERGVRRAEIDADGVRGAHLTPPLPRARRRWRRGPRSFAEASLPSRANRGARACP